MDQLEKIKINQTQKAIVEIKNSFQKHFAKNLNLSRVTAPLFVEKESGLNDHLDHKQKAVSFYAKKLNKNLEIVQSLAKWKRLALLNYGFSLYEGLYTDMNAIRADDDIDETHSIYVDQWDWEILINKNDCHLNFLKSIVNKIYSTIKIVQLEIDQLYDPKQIILPNNITFISSQELEDLYPHLSPSQREYEFVKIHQAIFIYQIGYPLKSGYIQSIRSPEYDNWNLNGDLIVYHKLNDQAIELSSMGIRVDKQEFIKQTAFANLKNDHKDNLYHSMILNDQLPQTIGGGIGQSRLCMFLLNKKHIGEVQVSVWPNDYKIELLKKGIKLL
ncbi:amino acid--tRNA ligase-related protein [Ureaplasma parvum]|uniref:amino acid--tRNA ligase-related protein n=1 Tax=Ureaplasma parvum TaxID=134821 RepID=UPI0026EB3E6D|nr:amino acid--tRNA ligase-related protein [Ureaplasma parvum]